MRSSVSAIIPVRNRPASIVNAVSSVLAQTVPALRIVVVDDGSTDSTASEIRYLADSAKNLTIVTIPHSGPACARNLGLAALDSIIAEAKFGPDSIEENLIAFLDSDDIWPPDFLARAQRRLDESPDIDLVVADRLERFHLAGPRLHSASCYDTDPWSALRRQSPRIMSCAVFRRRILADNPFPEGRFIGEDSALLIKLLAEGAKSAWLPGEPVVATSIPAGDQDRLTSGDRSRSQMVQDRIGSAEVYAIALSGTPSSIPRLVSGRLLAARWVAVLWHSVTALDRKSVIRSLIELWHCGVVATALGILDHFNVLAEQRRMLR